MRVETRMRGLMFLVALVLPLLGLTARPQAQPTQHEPWVVTLPANIKTDTAIEIENRCNKTHSFSLTPQDVPFLQILDHPPYTVPGHATKDINVRFDTNGMKEGKNSGQVLVKCDDCYTEPTCSQDRDVLPVALTIEGQPTTPPTGETQPKPPAPTAPTQPTAPPSTALPPTPTTTACTIQCDLCAGGKTTNCDDLRKKVAEKQSAMDAAYSKYQPLRNQVIAKQNELMQVRQQRTNLLMQASSPDDAEKLKQADEKSAQADQITAQLATLEANSDAAFKDYLEAKNQWTAAEVELGHCLDGLKESCGEGGNPVTPCQPGQTCGPTTPCQPGQTCGPIIPCQPGQQCTPCQPGQTCGPTTPCPAGETCGPIIPCQPGQQCTPCGPGQTCGPTTPCQPGETCGPIIPCQPGQLCGPQECTSDHPCSMEKTSCAMTKDDCDELRKEYERLKAVADAKQAAADAAEKQAADAEKQASNAEAAASHGTAQDKQNAAGLRAVANGLRANATTAKNEAAQAKAAADTAYKAWQACLKQQADNCDHGGTTTGGGAGEGTTTGGVKTTGTGGNPHTTSGTGCTVSERDCDDLLRKWQELERLAAIAQAQADAAKGNASWLQSDAAYYQRLSASEKEFADGQTTRAKAWRELAAEVAARAEHNRQRALEWPPGSKNRADWEKFAAGDDEDAALYNKYANELEEAERLWDGYAARDAQNAAVAGQTVSNLQAAADAAKAAAAAAKKKYEDCIKSVREECEKQKQQQASNQPTTVSPPPVSGGGTTTTSAPPTPTTPGTGGGTGTVTPTTGRIGTDGVPVAHRHIDPLTPQTYQFCHKEVYLVADSHANIEREPFIRSPQTGVRNKNVEAKLLPRSPEGPRIEIHCLTDNGAAIVTFLYTDGEGVERVGRVYVVCTE